MRGVEDLLGGVTAELQVAEGPPGRTLVELAREAGADEIVVGSRGFGGGRAMLGSVAHALLHETDRPVVILTRRAAERQARRAATGTAPASPAEVVGYDGSPAARAALDYALGRAHGHITIVYAYDAPSSFLGAPYFGEALTASQMRGRELLDELQSQDGLGQDVEFDLLEGPPAEAVARAAMSSRRGRDHRGLAGARALPRGVRERVACAAARGRAPGGGRAPADDRVSALAAAPHPAARRAWLSLILVAAIGAALYVGLPQIAGLDETWGRLLGGRPLVAHRGAALRVRVLYGLCRAVPRDLRRRRAPDRLARELPHHDGGRGRHTHLRGGGAGGIALTAWALSRLGHGAARARSRPDHLLRRALLGLHGRAGALRRRIAQWPAAGPGPVRVTVVPAAFGGFVIAGGLVTALLPRDLDDRVAAAP